MIGSSAASSGEWTCYNAYNSQRLVSSTMPCYALSKTSNQDEAKPSIILQIA